MCSKCDAVGGEVTGGNTEVEVRVFGDEGGGLKKRRENHGVRLCEEPLRREGEKQTDINV